ncbi:hypothetical protein NDK43_23845 [Neobacillus pocheonensis]|uniref:Uncharacterized protein n=1 Tax=Neobacillus pocheonensis TaxID=363869 RepID=A0ABT0WES6_9BACI|nr:hypothetical protein [Neobacillus pocheonensis]
MIKEALIKISKDIAWPAFKKLIKLFVEEIIKFIFVILKGKIREYWSKKTKEKEDKVQENIKKAQESDDLNAKGRLYKENEQLKRDIENLQQYKKDVEDILDSVQEKASKEIESKIEKSKADGLIEENDGKLSIKKRRYIFN